MKLRQALNCLIFPHDVILLGGVLTHGFFHVWVATHFLSWCTKFRQNESSEPICTTWCIIFVRDGSEAINLIMVRPLYPCFWHWWRINAEVVKYSIFSKFLKSSLIHLVKTSFALYHKLNCELSNGFIVRV